MGLKEDKTITDIVQAVKESDAKKTKGYDTQATVIRVEDGKAWVHIPGGVTETPAELTINAKPGDNVMVRVAGGRAFLLGNATNPPTDDATAKEALSNANDALQSAVNARRAADSAEASAATASAAAQDAVETAESVHGIAVQAQEDAETAKTNAQTAITNAAAAASAAQSAQNSADSALLGLSTVEDVVGVVNWMRTHGNYSAATETEVLDGTFYFTVATVSSPTGNPRQNMYYDLDNGVYTLTMDTTVDSQKTYYTLTQVTPPEGADPSALGYVKMSNLEDVVSTYVNTHLALTDEGLWLVPDDTANANKVLIATGGTGHTYPDAGTYIIDGSGAVLAKFGQTTVLGTSGKGSITLDTNGVSIKDTSGVLRTIFSSDGVDFYGSGKISQDVFGNKILTKIRSSGLYLVNPYSWPENDLGIFFSNGHPVISGPNSIIFPSGAVFESDIEIEEGAHAIINNGDAGSVYMPGSGQTSFGSDEAFTVEYDDTLFAIGTYDYAISSYETKKSVNILVHIGDDATSGVDKTIYDALNSLGWLSDCVES